MCSRFDYREAEKEEEEEEEQMVKPEETSRRAATAAQLEGDVGGHRQPRHL